MERVKIFLDDVRPCPEGWLLAKTADECIELLAKYSGYVEALSLDHDLGEEENGTGYDVVKWIESNVAYNSDVFVPPSVITVHSANPVGIKNMQAGINAIYKMRLR